MKKVEPIKSTKKESAPVSGKFTQNNPSPVSSKYVEKTIKPYRWADVQAKSSAVRSTSPRADSRHVTKKKNGIYHAVIKEVPERKTGKFINHDVAHSSFVPPHIRPITSEQDFEAAVTRSMALSEQAEQDRLTAAERDYLEVLLILIERWENEHHPFESQSTPLERLNWLLGEHGLTGSDLGRLLGQRQLGAKILSGERELSKAHIRILADRFKVNPGYFF